MAAPSENDEYASPPCQMHELAPSTDERQWADVRRWRKAERERLLGLRRSVELEDKDRYAQSIGRELDRLIGDVSGRTISGYWPIKAEPNLMFWMEGLEARGATCCLPVVVQPNTPLVFKLWRRGMKMVPGIWNIPTPADSPIVVPDIVLAPVLGFDEGCYRLGNGGGYFDRTLAVLQPRPLVVGVGYERLRIRTIYPQPHDVAMDVIVTEQGTAKPAG
ncbi:MAG TPA: 5-formyltetrahydrofolate cyclo-ligase [Reyranella sp.]